MNPFKKHTSIAHQYTGLTPPRTPQHLPQSMVIPDPLQSPTKMRRGSQGHLIATQRLALFDPFNILGTPLPPSLLQEISPTHHLTTSGIKKIMQHFDRCTNRPPTHLAFTADMCKKESHIPHFVFLYWEGGPLRHEHFETLQQWKDTLTQELGEDHCITIFTTHKYTHLPQFKTVTEQLRQIGVHLVCVEDIHALGILPKEDAEDIQVMLNYHKIGCEFSANSDWWRLLASNLQFGGAYIDFDCLPKSPQDSRCNLGDFFIKIWRSKTPVEFGGPNDTNCNFFIAPKGSKVTGKLLRAMIEKQREEFTKAIKHDTPELHPPFITRYFPSRSQLKQAVDKTTFAHLTKKIPPRLDPVMKLVVDSLPTVYTDLFDTISYMPGTQFRKKPAEENGALSWLRIWNKWEDNPEVLMKEIITFVETRMLYMGSIPVEFLFDPIFAKFPDMLPQIKAYLCTHYGYVDIEDPKIGLILCAPHVLSPQNYPNANGLWDQKTLEKAEQIATTFRQHYLNLICLELSFSHDKCEIDESTFNQKLRHEQVFADDTVVLRNTLTGEIQEVSILRLALMNGWSIGTIEHLLFETDAGNTVTHEDGSRTNKRAPILDEDMIVALTTLNPEKLDHRAILKLLMENHIETLPLVLSHPSAEVPDTWKQMVYGTIVTLDTPNVLHCLEQVLKQSKNIADAVAHPVWELATTRLQDEAQDTEISAILEILESVRADNSTDHPLAHHSLNQAIDGYFKLPTQHYPDIICRIINTLLNHGISIHSEAFNHTELARQKRLEEQLFFRSQTDSTQKQMLSAAIEIFSANCRASGPDAPMPDWDKLFSHQLTQMMTLDTPKHKEAGNRKQRKDGRLERQTKVSVNYNEDSESEDESTATRPSTRKRKTKKT